MNHHDSNVPTLALNNGVTLPAVGFGVFQTRPTRRSPAVRTALQTLETFGREIPET